MKRTISERERGCVTIYSRFDEYVHKVAHENNVTYKQANKIVTSVIDSVTTDIINGKTGIIPNLGSFSVKSYKEHRIKDINTGEYIVLPSTNKIKYTPNKWIINKVNYR